MLSTQRGHAVAVTTSTPPLSQRSSSRAHGSNRRARSAVIGTHLRSAAGTMRASACALRATRILRLDASPARRARKAIETSVAFVDVCWPWDRMLTGLTRSSLCLLSRWIRGSQIAVGVAAVQCGTSADQTSEDAGACFVLQRMSVPDSATLETCLSEAVAKSGCMGDSTRRCSSMHCSRNASVRVHVASPDRPQLESNSLPSRCGSAPGDSTSSTGDWQCTRGLPSSRIVELTLRSDVP
jgi:hypothetical protein